MSLVVVSIVILLTAAGYLSAISLSLILVSRSALEERAAAMGRSDGVAWLLTHQDAVRLSVSLVRTGCRVAVFAFVLIRVVGGTGEDVTLEAKHLAIAGLITVFVLWFVTVVLASALARHTAAGLIAHALPLIRLLGTVLMPVTRLFAFVDEAVRRLSGANLREEDDEVQADLLRRIEDDEREGRIDQKAAEMLENLVEFNTTFVSEVMTPRTRIDGLQYTDELNDIRDFIAHVGHSRIPVYRENLDNVIGILYVKDLIPYLGVDPPRFRLEPILRQPIIVPETKPVSDLLRDFQRGEVHMAVVIDEYGGTAGLVTIEDVLEEIVGEIQDEHDTEDLEEPSIETIDEHASVVAGNFRIDELNERLGLDLPADDYDTVAGFMLATLGRVPATGESFNTEHARFTTLAASPTQIERVRIELLREGSTCEVAGVQTDDGEAP